MSYDIIDTAEVLTRKHSRIPGLKTAIRYISSAGSQGKVITPAEARALANAGIRVALVHEWWGDFAHDNINARAGKRDGEYARGYAPKVGAPFGAAVYFAIDVDTSPSQIRNYVIPYFREIRDAMGSDYKVGIYGPGAACDAVIKAGYADYGWLAQARGWAGYKEFKPKAHLVQLMPKSVGGVDLDPDVAQVAEWGDYVPFQEIPKSEPVKNHFPVEVDDSSALNPDKTRINHNPAEVLDKMEEKRDLWDRFVNVIPAPLRSKVAWLVTGAGSAGAASVDRSDPNFMDTVWNSMHQPTFWLMFAVVVCSAGALFYYWKNSTGPKSWL